MGLFLTALVFILGAAVITIATSWAGKCQRCGSWRNWLGSHTSKDDHRPHLYFVTTESKCSDCGNGVHRSTSTHHRELRNPYDYYRDR